MGLVLFYVRFYLLKSIFDHCRNQSSQQRATKLKTWVGIDLDKPGVELFIDHEVKAEDLKIMMFSFRV